MKLLFKTKFRKLIDIARQVNLLIVLLCINLLPSGTCQDEWSLCPGESVRETKTVITQVEGYTIVYDIRSASCPRSNDGLFKLVSIIDKNLKSLDAIEFGGYSVDKNDEVFIALGPGGQTFSIVDQTLYIRFGSNMWVTKDSLVIPIGEPSMPVPKAEPNITINFEKTQHETCPGDMDGMISLLETPKYNSPSKITWDDGAEGFERSNLSAGHYPFTYEKEFIGKKCCKTSGVQLKTNKCISELFGTQFDGQIPEAWFNPDGNYTQDEGHGEFLGDGCLYIPLDFSSDDMAMALRLGFSGSITVEIIDEFFTTLAVGSFEGDQDIALPLDEIDIPNPHVYVKITAEDDTEIYDLDVFTFGEYLDFIVSLQSNSKSHSRNITEDVCVGDLITPGTKINIEGGITPFEFDWDLNGDMIFDDTDSLYHQIEITGEGLMELALQVRDYAGHLDTVYFEYNAYDNDTIMIGIPSLSIEESNTNLITICNSDGLFELSANMPDVVLTSSGAGLAGMTFDPSIAGVGHHLIVASSDLCDTPAALSINVIEDTDVSLTDLPLLYPCSEPLDLNSVIVAGSGGVWVLNDSNYIFNDTLYPDQSIVGINNLKYEIGGGLCLTTATLIYEVLPSPTVNLIDPSDAVSSSGPIVNLNDFLGTSTLGGVWSGTNILDGLFDPSGLEDGQYEFTYSVGEGDCEAMGNITIEVKTETSVETKVFGEIIVFPVPASNTINVCTKSSLPKTYNVYNTLGEIVATVRSSQKCMQIDLEGILHGCYILNIQSDNGQVSRTFIVME